MIMPREWESRVIPVEPLQLTLIISFCFTLTMGIGGTREEDFSGNKKILWYCLQSCPRCMESLCASQVEDAYRAVCSRRLTGDILRRKRKESWNITVFNSQGAIKWSSENSLWKLLSPCALGEFLVISQQVHWWASDCDVDQGLSACRPWQPPLDFVGTGLSQQEQRALGMAALS